MYSSFTVIQHLWSPGWTLYIFHLCLVKSWEHAKCKYREVFELQRRKHSLIKFIVLLSCGNHHCRHWGNFIYILINHVSCLLSTLAWIRQGNPITFLHSFVSWVMASCIILVLRSPLTTMSQVFIGLPCLLPPWDFVLPTSPRPIRDCFNVHFYTKCVVLKKNVCCSNIEMSSNTVQRKIEIILTYLFISDASLH